jgi:hypothetical protein
MTIDDDAPDRLRGGLAAVLCIMPIVTTLVIAMAVDATRAALIDAAPLLGRYACVVLLPALSLWVVARLVRRPMAAASVVAGTNAVAFVAFAGIAQTMAFMLLLSIGLLLGTFMLRNPVASPGARFTAMLAGFGAMAGLVGWVLPLPIHSLAIYLSIAAMCMFAGRHRLSMATRPMIQAWSQAAIGQPLASCFAVAVIGFAAVLTWLPSLNPDDNSAHLLLAHQLLAESYYRIDVSSQVFAVAPWLNNVLHAMTSVLAGGESRSVIGLGWLVAGCVGAYRLASLLGARGPYPWLAAALYASQPLAAYFGMTLQVDGASAAVLLHLVACCIELQRDKTWSASPWLIGSLCGMLAGLKISNGPYLLLLGVWLIWHHVSAREHRRLFCLLLIAAAVAGSSYFYATLITGNPLFPLFNGVFKSPYMAALNFSDQRWHAGVDFRSLWDITFSTPRYMESYVGAAGLSLLAFLGTWLVSAMSGGWRAALTLFAFASGLVIFSQIQYLRYVFPTIALLCTLAVVTIAALPSRRIGLISLTALIVVQCGLIRTTSWIVSAGAAEQLLREGPRAILGVEQTYVPERALIRSLDGTGRAYCLLFANASTSYVALAPGKSLAIGFYDPRMKALATAAIADPSGQRWKEGIERIGFTHVEFRPAEAMQGLQPALESLGFIPLDRRGESQVWYRPGADAGKCLNGTIAPRNEAHRLLH